MWCWRKTEISWCDRVKNEVIYGGKERREEGRREGRLAELVTSCLGKVL
jgi:hypothetical protein